MVRKNVLGNGKGNKTLGYQCDFVYYYQAAKEFCMHLP